MFGGSWIATAEAVPSQISWLAGRILIRIYRIAHATKGLLEHCNPFGLSNVARSKCQSDDIQRAGDAVTTRIYLVTLALTWLLAVLLVPCLENIPRMIAWLFLFACYLFYVLTCVIELECSEQNGLFVGVGSQDTQPADGEGVC